MLERMYESEFENSTNNQLSNVSYSTSAVSHWYFINGVDLKNIEELREHLQNAYLGNGDLSLYAFGTDRIQLCYETNDSYEYSENFACDLVDEISTSVSEFIASNKL